MKRIFVIIFKLYLNEHSKLFSRNKLRKEKDE